MTSSASVSNMGEVLLLIAGQKSPPVWLPRKLAEYVERIRAFRDVDDRLPKRADFAKRIEAFRSALRLVLEELDRQEFTVFLEHGGAIPGFSDLAVRDVLVSLADQAHDRSMLLARNGGRQRAEPSPNEKISGKQLCAWFTVHAMELCRDARPGADNADAHEIANLVWQLAGGFPLGRTTTTSDSQGEQPTGWREHIIKIAQIEVEQSARGEALRHWLTLIPALSLAELN